MGRDEDKTREELIAELRALRRKSGDECFEPGEAGPPHEGAALQNIAEQPRIDAILTALDTCLVSINRDMTVAWFSDTTATAFAGRYAIGQPCHACFAGSMSPCPHCPVSACFDSGQVEKTEQYNPADKKWYALTAHPVRDADGRPTHVLEGITDITSRKQAEDKLAFQNMVLDQIQDLVVLTDPAGIITYVNKAGTHMLGYPFKDLKGRPISVFGENAARGATQAVILEKALRDGAWRGEVVNYTAEGEEVLLNCRIQRVQDEHGTPVALCGISTDVTNYKKTEESLRQAEEKYRIIFERSLTGIAIANPQGRFQDCNQAFADMLGYTREEIKELTVADLTLPEDLEHELPLVMEVIDSKRDSMHIEKRYLHKEGHYVWVDLLTNVVRASSGKALYAIATVYDITGRKQAEEALAKSESKWRHILTTAPQIGISLDTEGTLVFANDHFLKLTGWERDEVLGKNWFKTFIPEPIRDDIRTLFKTVMAQKHVHGYSTHENDVLHRNGNTLTVAWSNVLELDSRGYPVEVTCLGIDVTERRRVENALASSEKKFRIIADYAYDWESWHDKQGALLWVNPAVQRITGRSAEECLAMREYPLPLIHPEDRHVFATLQAKALAGIPGNDLSFRIVREDAPEQLVWAAASWNPVRDENGAPDGYRTSIRDITDRKLTENILRESETRFRQIYEHTAIGLARVGLDFRNQAANQSYCAMLGYEEEELIGKHLAEITAPEIVQENLNNQARLARGEIDHFRLEKRFLHKHGKAVYGILDANLIRSSNGTPKYFLGSVLDITKRKSAEEALQQERNRLGAILHGTNAGTWEWNIRTGETTFNERWAEMVGYLLEELQPTSVNTWIDLCHPEDLNVSNALLEKHFKGDLEYYECEARMRHRDGHWVWVLDRGKVSSRAKDGTPLLMSGTHQDISERKRAEEALKASEQRFRILLEDMDMVAVQGYDQNRRVIYWNKASERLYGYAQGETMGRKLEDLIVPLPMRNEVVRSVRDWVENGVPIPSGELMLLHKNGSSVPVYSSHVMQVTSSGAKEMYCIDVDLSEIKMVHDQLLRAKEKAEAANRAKSDFLANMSHEIRTPLNGILGMLQLLQTTPINSEQQEYVVTAVQSSLRLTRLLSDILDLSRVEAGKMDIIATAFQLNDVLEATRQLFTPAASEKRLKFHVRIDPAIPPRLKGDTIRLQQILNNLVGNAIKFTKMGHVAIDAHPLPSRNQDEYKVLFTVSDSGIGISDDKLETLFKPFAQVSQGFTREHQGAGLGLSICRRLVNLMGGHIAVASEPGTGTSVYFSVLFGRADSAGEPPLPVHRSEKHDTSLSILIAEDDHVNRLTMVRLAQKLGHSVHAAADGQQALEALKGGAFDIVLMDVQMPVMNGVEATKRIRAGEAGEGKAGIPIIALTAYAMTGDKEVFLKAGMDGYLAKPVELQELEKALHQMCSGSETCFPPRDEKR